MSDCALVSYLTPHDESCESATLTAGGRLRSIRADRSLSREALAAVAGVSVSSIVRIERGDYVPKLTTLRKISGALDIAVTEFFDP